MRGALQDTGRGAAGAGLNALERRAGAAVDVGDVELVDIHLEIVLGVGERAL